MDVDKYISSSYVEYHTGKSKTLPTPDAENVDSLIKLQLLLEVDE